MAPQHCQAETWNSTLSPLGGQGEGHRGELAVPLPAQLWDIGVFSPVHPLDSELSTPGEHPSSPRLRVLGCVGLSFLVWNPEWHPLWKAAWRFSEVPRRRKEQRVRGACSALSSRPHPRSLKPEDPARSHPPARLCLQLSALHLLTRMQRVSHGSCRGIRPAERERSLARRGPAQQWGCSNRALGTGRPEAEGRSQRQRPASNSSALK